MTDNLKRLWKILIICLGEMAEGNFDVRTKSRSKLHREISIIFYFLYVNYIES